MRLFIVALLATALALPCRADEFCDGLKKIIADAPNNFVSVRGSADTGSDEAYSKPFMLPGSQGVFINSPPCEVRVWQRKYTYSCYFKASPANAEGKKQVISFTARVATCLSVTAPNFDYSAPHDTNWNASSNRGPFRFLMRGADVQTGLMYPPDGGPGTLYLNVGHSAA
jgi:hypothetical protein